MNAFGTDNTPVPQATQQGQDAARRSSPMIESVPVTLAAPEPAAGSSTQDKPKRAKSAIMPPANANLSDDVGALEASLGRSLGVKPGPNGYDPDLFVKSVAVIHDKLVDVRAALSVRQDELDAREHALSVREDALRRAEAKVAALTALQPTIAALGQRRGLWALLRGK